LFIDAGNLKVELFTLFPTQGGPNSASSDYMARAEARSSCWMTAWRFWCEVARRRFPWFGVRWQAQSDTALDWA